MHTLKSSVFNLGDETKQSEPILLRLIGTLNVVNTEQDLKTYPFISFKPAPVVKTPFNLEQHSNASAPIDVTESGIVIS